MNAIQATRFAGTSMINGHVISRIRHGNDVPKELAELSGFKGWSGGGNIVYYDTGMTIQAGEGPVLNNDDNVIRGAAKRLADQFFKGDVNKVLFQSPVTLNSGERDLLSFALIQKRGWSF